MKIPTSPITGKPMQVIYEPDTVTFRGEKFDCTYISFYDEASGESYTTTESDGIWLNEVINQYRANHGIPDTEEIFDPIENL